MTESNTEHLHDAKRRKCHISCDRPVKTQAYKYCMTSHSSYVYNIHTKHKWVPCLDLGPISETSRCVYANSFERKSKIARASAPRHVWGRETSGYHKRLGSHSLASMLFLYLAHSHTSHWDPNKVGLYLSERKWFVEIQKHLYFTGEGLWDSVSRYGDFRHNYLCQMQYDQEVPVTSFMAAQLWPWIWILLFLEADTDRFLFYPK